jgi:ferredoxin
VVPKSLRGKPEFDLEKCIGCGACVNVCPTEALTMVDELQGECPVRKITLRYDTCIFCGNCSENCTTTDGIKLSNEWDLAGLDREAMKETHEFEIQMCEKCGAFVGPKKHLIWIYEKLGPLAYTNPSLLIAKSGQLATDLEKIDSAGQKADNPPQTSDFMRILCPKCKCELNIQL